MTPYDTALILRALLWNLNPNRSQQDQLIQEINQRVEILLTEIKNK